jgi:hypothetical protein
MLCVRFDEQARHLDWQVLHLHVQVSLPPRIFVGTSTVRRSRFASVLGLLFFGVMGIS